MPAQLKLSAGTVALPGTDGVLADVVADEGRIVAICAPGGAPPAELEVDCAGLLVLPGAVDAHVHLGDDIRVPRSAREAASETAAAASGGVTTVLAYLIGSGSYGPVFDEARREMAASSLVDFGFHFCVGTEEQVAEIPGYVGDLGVSSFKVFMSFRGEEGAYLGLPGSDDGLLIELLEAAARSGAMVNPHTENIELVWSLRRRGADLRRRADLGEIGPLEAWNQSRPPIVEAEAAQRVALLAGEAGASCYVVHVSCAAALELLAAARRRGGDVFVETCPHYLTHDATSGLGSLGKVNPPLRGPADREALWAALVGGGVDVVGSDHVPRPRAAKQKPVFEASAGFPGCESLLAVLLSEGVAHRGLPVRRLTELVAERPARLFGLYPRKGVVQVGSDADFAVVDLARTRLYSQADVVSSAGYSIYEGWQLQGRVVHTILRGEMVMSEGLLRGAGGGRYLARRASGRAALDAGRR